MLTAIDDGVEIIRRGGLVIYPTETLYGLGCDATNEAAIARLLALKGRAEGKPPPVLVANGHQLARLVDELPDIAARLMAEYWPGALTLVLPARAGVAGALTGTAADGTRTVAVRQTAHPLARALCEAVGTPLVATSANFAGATGNAANPRSLDDIAPALRHGVGAVLDGGVVAGRPSTVIDCTVSPPRLLRAGALHLPDEVFSK